MTVEGQAVIVAVRVVKTVEVVISCVLAPVGEEIAEEETAGDEAAVVWDTGVVWIVGVLPSGVLAELPVVAPEEAVISED